MKQKIDITLNVIVQVTLIMLKTWLLEAQMDGAYWFALLLMVQILQTREHIFYLDRLVSLQLLCFLIKLDMVDDEELLELVDMEVRDLLSFYEYDGDNTPVVTGSALGGLNGEVEWVGKINELMAAVDSWIPEPVRDNEKPFLMPIEDVFTITGRGTGVATGRIETGVNTEIQLILLVWELKN